MAGKASALPPALHAHLGLLDEPCGTVLSRSDRGCSARRQFPARQRTMRPNPGLPGRTQCQPDALHLERQRRRNTAQNPSGKKSPACIAISETVHQLLTHTRNYRGFIGLLEIPANVMITHCLDTPGGRKPPHACQTYAPSSAPSVPIGRLLLRVLADP